MVVPFCSDHSVSSRLSAISSAGDHTTGVSRPSAMARTASIVPMGLRATSTSGFFCAYSSTAALSHFSFSEP